MPLTPADVHNVAFSKPPIGKRGYNEDEVDAFLDLVEQELSRLIEENADLRQRVAELDAELADAKSNRGPGGPGLGKPVQQAPPPEPVKPVVQAPPSAPIPVVPAAPAPSDGGADANMQAAKVLSLAQEMADRLTSDAKSEAENLLANARANSERLVNDARARSEEMIADARHKSDSMLSDAQTRSDSQLRQAKEKADALQADAERKHTEIMGTITQQRNVLESRIQTLKTFEREYRVRLKSYLESQLEELENRGSAVPVDEGDSFDTGANQLAPASFGQGE
ncbi:DivIVA domain-containing protein [Nocardia sp. NPDC051750]|uniref:DivIVA-like cell division protein Wag31 n=1 Tax=Nocardia sp. NPDC051750 TaxID=3364325 RepID=UPI0037A1993E